MAISKAIIAALIGIAVRGGDVHARWRSFTDTLEAVGLDQVNYGLLDPAAATREAAEVLFLSSMRSDWIDYYGERRFDLDDPHVVRVRAGAVSPYLYDGAQAVDRLEDPDAREVIGQAAEAGLRAQLQVTLLGRDGLRPAGGMCLGSSLGTRDFHRLVEGSEGDLVMVANLFHQRALGSLRRLRADVRPLSARERDCLQYVAEGLRAEAIADRMGLARVTVDMHLRRARVKLRAETLPQAVARALDFGEIEYGAL